MFFWSVSLLYSDLAEKFTAEWADQTRRCKIWPLPGTMKESLSAANGANSSSKDSFLSLFYRLLIIAGCHLSRRGSLVFLSTLGGTVQLFISGQIAVFDTKLLSLYLVASLPSELIRSFGFVSVVVMFLKIFPVFEPHFAFSSSSNLGGWYWGRNRIGQTDNHWTGWALLSWDLHSPLWSEFGDNTKQSSGSKKWRQLKCSCWTGYKFHFLTIA